MEFNQTLDNEFSADFALTSEIRSYLQETAKWTYFISIVGFVGVGLLVIVGILMSTILGSVPEVGVMPFSPMIFSVVYIAMAALYVLPLLYLFRFASNMKKALRTEDDSALAVAFLNLKSHYKFLGILMAVFLGIYALAILLGLLGGGLAYFAS